MKRISLMVAIAFSMSLLATAQPKKNKVKEKVDSMATVNAYLDSLLAYRQQQMSMSQGGNSDDNNVVKPDGRYYRLFAPLTFYHSPASRSLSISDNSGSSAGGDNVSDVVDRALMAVYLNRPDLVMSTETKLDKAGTVRDDLDKPVKNDVDLSQAVEPLPETPDIIPQGLVIQKPNFWTLKGDGNLQLMQTFVSDNWYKGGESNYSMVGQVTLSANYNNKSGVQLENILELKLGFLTSPSDTVHKFKTNNDLIRYTGRLGLQASKKWYYTLQLLAYTQFTRGYKSNDKMVYSDFMSPFNLNLGLGMTYSTANKKGTFNLNASMAPVSYNMKICREIEKIKPEWFGIEPGRHFAHQVGSKMEMTMNWKISLNVSMSTRFFVFTDYDYIQGDLENTLNFSINKYLSTQLYMHLRYDSSRDSDPTWKKWQIKEILSLGFSYKI